MRSNLAASAFRFARRKVIAVAGIVSSRKQADDDPLNMISGTTGLTGAVDGIYILKKDKRTGNTAKVIATGRDIEQREFTLEFNRNSHLWNLVSDDTEHTLSPAGAVIATIKNYLQREEIFIGSATELAEQLRTKTPPAVLSKTLMQNQQALAAQGIQYSYSRTGQRREITLLYDGNDSNDGKSDTAPIPNLLSQVSLLSQRPPYSSLLRPCAAFALRCEKHAR